MVVSSAFSVSLLCVTPPGHLHTTDLCKFRRFHESECFPRCIKIYIIKSNQGQGRNPMPISRDHQGMRNRHEDASLGQQHATRTTHFMKTRERECYISTGHFRAYGNATRPPLASAPELGSGGLGGGVKGSPLESLRSRFIFNPGVYNVRLVVTFQQT